MNKNILYLAIGLFFVVISLNTFADYYKMVDSEFTQVTETDCSNPDECIKITDLQGIYLFSKYTEKNPLLVYYEEGKIPSYSLDATLVNLRPETFEYMPCITASDKGEAIVQFGLTLILAFFGAILKVLLNGISFGVAFQEMLDTAGGTCFAGTNLEPYSVFSKTFTGNIGDLALVEKIEQSESLGLSFIKIPKEKEDPYEVAIFKIPAKVIKYKSEKFKLKLKGIPPCESGPEAMPNIKYSWKWDEIGKDFCSSSPLISEEDSHYCDSTQFTISLLKIIKEMEESSSIGYLDSVLLLRDAFSADFYNDFYNYYLSSNQFFGGAPEEFNPMLEYLKKGDAGGIVIEKNQVTCVNPNAAGEYALTIDKGQAGQPYKYKVTLNCTTEKTGTNLLDIAIDSELGSSAYDGDGTRIGYGSNFDAAKENQSVWINLKSTIEEALVKVPTEGITNKQGLNNILAEVESPEPDTAINLLKYKTLLELNANPEEGYDYKLKLYQSMALPIVVKINQKAAYELSTNNAFLFSKDPQCWTDLYAQNCLGSGKTCEQSKGTNVWGSGGNLSSTPISGFVLYAPFDLRENLVFKKNDLESGQNAVFKTPYNGQNQFGFTPSNMSRSLDEAVTAVRQGRACIIEPGSDNESIIWNEGMLLSQLKEAASKMKPSNYVKCYNFNQ